MKESQRERSRPWSDIFQEELLLTGEDVKVPREGGTLPTDPDINVTEN